jgi:hypothetical protein
MDNVKLGTDSATIVVHEDRPTPLYKGARITVGAMGWIIVRVNKKSVVIKPAPGLGDYGTDNRAYRVKVDSNDDTEPHSRSVYLDDLLKAMGF